MNINRVLSLVLFALLPSLFLSQPAFAQALTATQAQEQLVGAWLVTVSGESRTRTLRIIGATPNGSGYSLDAVYGWTDGNQTPVRAEIVATAEKPQMLITTQPGSKIDTRQNANGAFVGTFTSVNGNVKEITIEKSSEDMLAKAKQAMPSPTIIQPTDAVPAVCAAFIGRWKGAWPNNMTGRSGDPRWLWVTEIDEKCTAKFAYQYDPSAPRNLQSGEIKDGQLITPCTKGTCTFTSRGGDLWVDYKGSDGWNTTVFRKDQ